MKQQECYFLNLSCDFTKFNRGYTAIMLEGTEGIYNLKNN
jgi:hypothetical protein